MIGPAIAPVRRLVAALIVGLLAVTACSSSGSSLEQVDGSERAPEGYDGRTEMFDPTRIHDLSVEVDTDTLADMIDAYEESGDKNWIEANVTIDGFRYGRAGLRLKGNLSLEGASDAEPRDLPYKIRLDKFVADQNHGGVTSFAVRSNPMESSLNEAVALDLLDEIGLASQPSAHYRFSMDDSPPSLRLVVELPEDEVWSDGIFDGDGALFKVRCEGDWAYHGDDPADYEVSFKQENGRKRTGPEPVIDLVRFVDEADDATFADGLGDHLDVEAFATYLAMMDRIGNVDDIGGLGNNAYLWWDEATDRLTVVPWDLNLAFSVLPADLDPDASDTAGPDGYVPSERLGDPNPLVTRFFSVAAFDRLYQQATDRVRGELFESGFAQEVLDARVRALVDGADDLIDADTVRFEATAIDQFFR